jgi:hypothetical protein
VVECRFWHGSIRGTWCGQCGGCGGFDSAHTRVCPPSFSRAYFLRLVQGHRENVRKNGQMCMGRIKITALTASTALQFQFPL